jgi:hypothetical protein
MSAPRGPHADVSTVRVVAAIISRPVAVRAEEPVPAFIEGDAADVVATGLIVTTLCAEAPAGFELGPALAQRDSKAANANCVHGAVLVGATAPTARTQVAGDVLDKEEAPVRTVVHAGIVVPAPLPQAHFAGTTNGKRVVLWLGRGNVIIGLGRVVTRRGGLAGWTMAVAPDEQQE